MNIKTAQSLNFPLLPEYNKELCHRLSSFIVVEYYNKQESILCVRQQYEFLTRAAWLTTQHSHLLRGEWLRTRYGSVFFNYVRGDFVRSRIWLLRHSKAMHFKTDGKYLYCRLSNQVLNIVRESCIS